MLSTGSKNCNNKNLKHLICTIKSSCRGKITLDNVANIKKFQEQTVAYVNIMVYEEESCRTLRRGQAYNIIVYLTTSLSF